MARTDSKPLLQDSVEPASPGAPQRMPNEPNRPGKYEGEVANLKKEPFAEPLVKGHPAGIEGMDSLQDDIGEKSGFLTYGYLDKSNTPFGEAAKFNFLPPGMDISNQENIDINQMPLKMITGMGYEGDGWQPAPRDIPE